MGSKGPLLPLPGGSRSQSATGNSGEEFFLWEEGAGVIGGGLVIVINVDSNLEKSLQGDSQLS